MGAIESTDEDFYVNTEGQDQSQSALDIGGKYLTKARLSQGPYGAGAGSRKAMNRRIIKAKNEAEQSSVAVASRIKLLATEDTKMLKKIEQTKKLADKLIIA